MRYQHEHGKFLAGPSGEDLVWCPEGWLESEVRLLGDPSHLGRSRAVDLGCGAGQATRWLARHCRQVIGIDISHEQLRLGREWFAPQDGGGSAAPVTTPVTAPATEVANGAADKSTPQLAATALVQADAHEIPLPDTSVDVLVSAFGVLAFIPDLRPVMTEISRVLTPSARAVVSMPHPMRWVFPDDPAPQSLTVTHPYADRTPYIETDESGSPCYAEFHHTLADIVAAVTTAGLVIERIWEPDWRASPEHVFGGWSAATVAMVPKTLIVRLRRLERN